MEIDFKDRELLFELDCNSRQSFSLLARTLGISKDAVKYRVQKLISAGIIKSFNAVIDVGKLGFYSFRILIKLYQATPEKEEEIIRALLKNNSLLWMVRIQGDWDLNTWFLYKSVSEMNDFWNEFRAKYGNYIIAEELGIYSKVTYFGRPFLAGKKSNDLKMPFITLPSPVKLDAKELQIIQSLSENSRASIVEIAEKTNITTKTVIEKIKRLTGEKVILGYRIELDLEKLGLQYYKIYLSTFNTTPEKLKRLKQFLFEHPNIVYDDEILGGYDIEFEIQCKDDSELREILALMRKKFSEIIKDYKIQHYFKEYRLRFLPECN